MATSLFHMAVSAWLTENNVPNDGVVKVKQETRRGGYCHTCAWSEEIYEITYFMPDGETATYDYHCEMGDFVTALAAVEV